METKNPALFIPPELWTLIFEKVYESWLKDSRSLSTNDLFNCSKVCVTFQYVLKPLRCLWLFQEVLPYINLYLRNTSTKNILSCRLVCKAWKRAVDHFLETHDIFAKIQLEHGQTHRQFLRTSFPNQPLPICCLSTSQDIYAFLQDIETNNQVSPFPGNSLRIRYSPLDNDDNVLDTDLDQFWNIDVERLLSRFGRFITVLYLHTCHFPLERGVHYVKFVKRVIVCLRHTPNLRRLCVRGHLNKSIISSHANYNWNCSMGLVESENVSLPYLQSVEFNTGGRHCFALPLSVQLCLLSSSLFQLKRLHLANLRDDLSIEILNKKRWKTLKGCLPNLEELDVTIIFQSDLQRVFHLASKSTKLSCLTIKIVNVTWEQLSQYFPNCIKDLLCEYDEYFNSLVPLRFDLGTLLKSVHKMFSKSLTTLIIFAELTARKYCKVNQNDFKILKKFHSLRYLHIEGFSLNKVEIVRELPNTLEQLVLEGCWEKARFDCKVGRYMPGISYGLPNAMSVYYSELWDNVPRLRRVKAICWNEGKQITEIYCYRKEHKEWVIKRERDNTMVKVKVARVNDSCCSMV